MLRGASGDWGRAFGLLEEMEEERTSLEVTTYNAVITACEKGAQVEKALRIFSELRQWHKPDVISYSSSISACGAGGHWGLGWGLNFVLGITIKLNYKCYLIY